MEHLRVWDLLPERGGRRGAPGRGEPERHAPGALVARGAGGIVGRGPGGIVGRGRRFALAVALISLSSPIGTAWGVDQTDPMKVVSAYCNAMKDGTYANAYDLLTPYMQSDLDRATWTAQTTALMGFVEIQDCKTFPAVMEGDSKARVPNLLKSKDRFINQTGADEHELYTVIRDDQGVWRIERQELVETDNLKKWFPEEAKK